MLPWRLNAQSVYSWALEKKLASDFDKKVQNRRPVHA